MEEPNLKDTLVSIIATLQNADAIIRQCNDEQYPKYIGGVDDALLNEVVEAVEEIRYFIPLGPSDPFYKMMMEDDD